MDKTSALVTDAFFPSLLIFNYGKKKKKVKFTILANFQVYNSVVLSLFTSLCDPFSNLFRIH